MSQLFILADTHTAACLNCISAEPSSDLETSLHWRSSDLTTAICSATAVCRGRVRPTPTDARALSTQEIQENQKIRPLPRYTYGGFETAHVDTSELAQCTYVFRIVVSSHMAELRRPGHPPTLGAFDRVLGPGWATVAHLPSLKST